MASDPTSAPRPGGPRDSKGGPDRKPVRMGKYEVLKHVATGGMAAVYKARDTEAGRDVALKVLPKELAEKPAMLERFRREARSAAKLRHENIVTLLDSGDYHGTFYLVMEFVEGVDLYRHVKKQGLLDGEEARLIVLQAARALRHAHEMGVVHRDIKPSNFLLSWDAGRPCVKLLDFGLARELDDELSRVTKAGTTLGTIDYMSPEQARDSGAADIRSDLYSLGATWFHLLAGQPPFAGSITERLLKLMQEEPPDLRDLNSSVSDETWDVVRRLLAKRPAERYQTPDELIEALDALEGRTCADPRRPRAAPKKLRGPSSFPAAEPADPGPARPHLWYALAGVAAFLLVGVLAAALSMPRRPPETESLDPPAPAEFVLPPRHPLPLPPPNDDPPPEPLPAPADPKSLRPLYFGAGATDVKALRERVTAPASPEPPAETALTVRVGRAAAPSPTTFRSLREACQAGAPGQPLVVEIHDNGPLFEPPIDAVEGRDLWVKAAPGYRPLIVWDVQAVRKPDQPLVFLPTRGGRLSVEGVELALRWPEALPNPATVFDVQGGALTVRDCTVSVAGKPREGVVVARYTAKVANGVCRFTRCQIRGAGVTALAMQAPDATALFDGCLVVGGRRPLLSFRTWKRPTACRVVRSTMVGGPSLVELKPAGAGEEPLFDFLGWDCLFSGGGTLFDVPEGVPIRGVKWHAVNCLYTGWKRLFPGVPDHAGWQRRWGLADGDASLAEPWPEQAYNEPATLPAATYQPAGPVLYAATADPRKPLGCDLAALPPSRDAWVARALDPVLAAPDLPSDDGAPEIPPLGDGCYTGGVIDVTTCDLGALLATIRRPAPRVVLHLKGSGEAMTAPIRLKGVHLVLHFVEPPDRDTPPLALTLARTATPAALIDLEGGGLDVVGGVLRVPDQSAAKASHVIRVRGGDVRLYRTRVEGPKLEVPEGYVAAVSVAGSGDPAADKGRSLAANECVILSSKAGVVLDGVGCRAALRQCLVVTGREGLRLLPGRACKGRAGMGAALANVTFACQTAVAHLGDAPAAGVPTEPVVVQARDCAYLNPFPGKPSKAGLLTWEGDALPRGLLVWHGQGEGFDERLHFAASPAAGGISDTKEGYGPWARLWGAGGARDMRPLSHLLDFTPRRWALERLALKMRDAPGANLERLGVAARKPMR